MRKRTHEEFIKQMKEINDNIEILSEYLTINDYVKCKCKIDGYEWSAIAKSLLNGHGCARCANHEPYTAEYFRNKIFDINPNIMLLSDYLGNKNTVKCKCKIDDYEWNARPTHLLKGIGCPKCAGVATKTTQQFINELYNINKNIEVIGEYHGNKKGIECKCLIDGHIWSPSPNSLLRGRGCPKCGGKLQHTHDEFVELVHNINQNITIISKYIDTQSKVKCKCNIDGHIWDSVASSLLSGRGCPVCKSSKGERKISKYLKSKGINFKQEYRFDDCRNIHKLPFDFYLPLHNITIEYDGEHHSQIVRYSNESVDLAKERFVQRQINDTIKTQYCNKHNIKLIRIPYTEYNEVENILDKFLF